MRISTLLATTMAFGLTAFTVGPQASAKSPATCNTPTTPFCSSTVPPPAGWKGPLFKLSQAYPKVAPKDVQPWLKFDPMTEPDAYLRSVLEYFYEGNIRATERSFDPAKNTVRGWYNAPWMDFTPNGREPIHGLTRELASVPFQIAPGQTKVWNNYAIGFYNAPGGVAIGRVWSDHGQPDASKSLMPEGTVSAKLLFTTAPISEVPFLAGSPEWTAYVYKNDQDGSIEPDPKSPRLLQNLRLLQIDIAVKDERAKATGWVFGTFVYGGGIDGPPGRGWRNVAPVGVMWGNDPGYDGTGSLKESWINPKVRLQHLGYQNRLNGPVDNPASSCLSCHSTAESPMLSGLAPGSKTPAKDIANWFRNVPAGTPFDAKATALDYSLQLAFGIANFQKARTLSAVSDPTAKAVIQKKIDEQSRFPPRSGKATQ